MRALIVLAAMLTTILFCTASLADTRIDPAYDIPEYVTWLLDVARGELGYTEGAHGYTKYGEWAGDPYAQWCAEFLCWCVHTVDETHGTELLDSVYPLYSSSNVGKNWFIDHGRYLVRWGNLDGWGYQWLKGESDFLTTGDYIPQPGDWVFFTWTNDLNTDHVAMVEYCTRDDGGNVTIHVIEGNTPASVKRTEYPLAYRRILGFGTVHDVADWTMRSGNVGEKVRQLQFKLAQTGYLAEDKVDGRFGSTTQASLMQFQEEHHLRANGIANLSTQQALDRVYLSAVNQNPSSWIVDDDEDFTLDLSFDDMFAQDWTDEEEVELLTEDLFSPESDNDLAFEDSLTEIGDPAPAWVQTE